MTYYKGIFLGAVQGDSLKLDRIKVAFYISTQKTTELCTLNEGILCNMFKLKKQSQDRIEKTMYFSW